MAEYWQTVSRNLKAGYSPSEIVDAYAAHLGVQSKVDDLRAQGIDDKRILQEIDPGVSKGPDPYAEASQKMGARRSLVPLGAALVSPVAGVRQMLGNEQAGQEAVEAQQGIERNIPGGAGGLLAGKAGVSSLAAIPVMMAAPGAFAAGASVPARYAGAAALGASGSAVNPLEEGASRAVEAAKGAALGIAGQGVGEALGKAISPAIGMTADAQHAANLARARGIGYRPTPGQVAGSKGVQQAELSAARHPVTAAGFAKRAEENDQAITAAVTKSFGESVPKVDAEYMARTFNRLGDVFNKVTRNKDIPLGQDFVTRVQSIRDEFAGPWESLRNEKLATVVDDAIAAAQSGKISAKDYQRVVSRISSVVRQLKRSDAADPDAIEGIARVKDALDDEAAKVMPVADRAIFNKARKQYANLMAAVKSGAIDVEKGTISGQKLYNEMARRDKRGVLTGRVAGPAADAARVANAFRPVVGDPGTATNLSVPMMATSGLGALASGADPATAAVVGIGGSVAGNLASRAYMSETLGRLLMNEAIPPDIKRLIATQAALQSGAQ